MSSVPASPSASPAAGAAPAGGAASAGAAASGATASPSAAGGAPAAGAPAGAPSWLPAGVPSHMVKESAELTLPEVFKAYDGARKALSERGVVPEAPDGYKIEWGGELAPHAERLSKDPLTGQFLTMFHKAGLSDRQAQALISEALPFMMQTANAGQPSPADLEAQATTEFLSLGEGVSPEEKKASAAKRTLAAEAVFNTLTNGWPEAEKTAALSLLDSADGIRVFERLTARIPEATVALGGQAAGAVNAGDLAKMQADPRALFGSATYDPAYAKQVNDAYRRTLGDAPRE